MKERLAEKMICSFFDIIGKCSGQDRTVSESPAKQDSFLNCNYEGAGQLRCQMRITG